MKIVNFYKQSCNKYMDHLLGQQVVMLSGRETFPNSACVNYIYV